MKAPILGQGVVGAAGKEGRAGREGWERGRGACGPAPPHPAHGPSPEPWKIPRDLALREEPSQAQMLSGTVQVPHLRPDASLGLPLPGAAPSLWTLPWVCPAGTVTSAHVSGFCLCSRQGQGTPCVTRAHLLLSAAQPLPRLASSYLCRRRMDGEQSPPCPHLLLYAFPADSSKCRKET